MTDEGTQIAATPAIVARKIPVRKTAKRVPFKNASRLQQSFTAAAERKALAWLAGKLPERVNSDHLTLLGFLAMFLAGASYALARTHRAGLLLATFFLALNWFGDSLDGTLARLRNRQRPRYGFYVDHMIDTFGGFFLMGGLSISGLVDWRIALGMFVAFLMLSVQVYLATYTVGTFQLSFAKFGPTEIRILLALGNVALSFHPDARIFGSPYRIFDVGGIIAIAGMSLMLIVSTIFNTVKLYRAEPVR
ncbi:MAG TPA: CDP-alcohol phosphatidyltransferase family protein [Candidatus Acidoferrum sp.]|jgi:archaetidylinositol phosphate synthase|nr:CDP-alcohol phosphatidyltransferase family protein [Candidatus Acidoferrum sp.]